MWVYVRGCVYIQQDTSNPVKKRISEKNNHDCRVYVCARVCMYEREIERQVKHDRKIEENPKNNIVSICYVNNQKKTRVIIMGKLLFLRVYLHIITNDYYDNCNIKKKKRITKNVSKS